MALKVGGTTAQLPTAATDEAATTQQPAEGGEKPGVNAATLLEKTSKLVEKTAELQENFDATQTVKDLHDVSKEFKTTVTKAQAVLSGTASKATEGAEKAEEHAGHLGRHLGVATAVVGVATLPGKSMTAYHDVRKALQSGSAQDRDHAIGTVSDAVSTAVATTDAGIQVGKRLVSKSAERTATKVAEVATEHAVAHAAEEAGAKVVEHVAEKVALKTGLKVAGKAGALLVPGVNIALAAADAGTFYSAMKDPNASKGRKITTGITALGSALAATDIPVVGWIGDAISIGGTIAQGFFSK